MSKYNTEKGYTLVELLLVVSIIGILSMIAIPAYVGQQSRAARVEAYQNLEALRLHEEQLFSETAAYAASVPSGACNNDSDNTAAIQDELPGFQPGANLSFSYCIELDVNLAGTATPNCFRAIAIGNTGTRIEDETFVIDCTNAKNY